MSENRTISDVYRTALGSDAAPFAYQSHLAETGLPEVLDVPTGCGKTPAVLLSWVFRRLLHPDLTVRAAMPRRLIWCAPLRSLTEQTRSFAEDAVGRLGLSDQIGVHTLMGGRELDSSWRVQLDREAILICTLDMALSRALNRGYRSSQHAWPIDFAIFNNDAHWVFDEVQLMGPALATSRQIQALRNSFGTALPTRTTWMSATVDLSRFHTIDADEPPQVTTLDEFAADPRLDSRLNARKRLRCARVDDPKKYGAGFADVVSAEHRSGHTTIAVLNTVDQARDVYKRLKKISDEEVVLLHSRFRPVDRAAALEAALSSARGRIVVSTQVIEAGVDMSSATLVTEVAPWSSIVQRAGRCNRWGEQPDARLVIVHPSNRSPYDDADLESAWLAAQNLDGATVTPSSLAAVRPAERTLVVTPVLRRSDLLDLFDTAPDLSGNSTDVSQYIRDGDEIALGIAWWDLNGSAPGADQRSPHADELCPVPVGEARALVDKRGPAWRFDTSTSSWVPTRGKEVRPGQTLVIAATAGGYGTELGFDHTSKAAVEVISVERAIGSPTSDDEATEDDPLSVGFGVSVTLSKHLLDTEAAASQLCEKLMRSMPAEAMAIVRAARLHDLGKAHEVWQQAIHDATIHPATEEAPDSQVLAKSGSSDRLRYSRPGFRHELASALVVLDQPHLAGDADPDVVAYLVAAHHGRVRQTMRSTARDSADRILGIQEGDRLAAVDLGEAWSTEPAVLSLESALLGRSTTGQPSWAERVLRLLDHYGPFVLAWLETVVRMADWRASMDEGQMP